METAGRSLQDEAEEATLQLHHIHACISPPRVPIVTFSLKFSTLLLLVVDVSPSFNIYLLLLDGSLLP